MSNGKQSFMELTFIASEVPKHDARLAEKVAKLNRLHREAADAIERHTRLVAQKQQAFDEMAKMINKSKITLLDRLRSLGTLDSDAFARPSVIRTLREADLAAKRMLRTMKEGLALGSELEHELNKIIALNIQSARSGNGRKS